MSYKVHDTQVDSFTWGYITCLFFTTSEYEFPEYCYSGEFAISKQDVDRLTGDALLRIIEDCSKFQTENESLLDETTSGALQNGMDFAYSRNGHGVSFVDRAYDHGWSEETAKKLKSAAQQMGEIHLFKVNCDCYETQGDCEPCVCGEETKVEIL